jgi:hypothetical protein
MSSIVFIRQNSERGSPPTPRHSCLGRHRGTLEAAAGIPPTQAPLHRRCRGPTTRWRWAPSPPKASRGYSPWRRRWTGSLLRPAAMGRAASRHAGAAALGRGRRRACLGRAPRGGWSWIHRGSGSGRAAPPSPLGVKAGAGGGRAAGRASRLTAVAASATPDAAVTMRAHPGLIWFRGRGGWVIRLQRIYNF